jgi:hypothetical protein
MRTWGWLFKHALATHMFRRDVNLAKVQRALGKRWRKHPHWQAVDSKGHVYQLDRLQAKNGKYNKSIVLPSYIPDVVKVQIWCSFAETLLGEASFSAPVM